MWRKRKRKEENPWKDTWRTFQVRYDQCNWWEWVSVWRLHGGKQHLGQLLSLKWCRCLNVPTFATSSKDINFFFVPIESNLPGWCDLFLLPSLHLLSMSACYPPARCTVAEYILCPVKSITWSSWFHNWTQTSHCSASSRSCLCMLSWSLWSLQPGNVQMKHSQQRRRGEAKIYTCVYNLYVLHKQIQVKGTPVLKK